MTTLLQASLTAVLTSLSSTGSRLIVSLRPLRAWRTSRTFSALFERLSRTLGISATGALATRSQGAAREPPGAGSSALRSRTHQRLLARLSRRVRQRPQLVEGPAQQARDLHLGDAHALGDLRLCQILDEAHLQDRALARRNVSQHCRHRGVELDELVALVLAADRVAVGGACIVVCAGSRSVE